MKTDLTQRRLNFNDSWDSSPDEFLFYSITVQDAALLLALDLGEFDGEPYSQKDIEPFVQHTVTRHSPEPLTAWKNIVELLRTSPSGTVQKVRDSILKLLIDSIEHKNLHPDHTSRDLDGELIPEETFLDFAALGAWARERGYSTETLWGEYLVHEGELVARLCETHREVREAQLAGLDWRDHRYHQKDPNPSLRDELLSLKQENAELREQLNSNTVEKPLGTRYRENLLRLVAVMAIQQFGKMVCKPHKVATVIEKAAQQLGVQLGDDTIVKRLKEGLDLLPQDAIPAE